MWVSYQHTIKGHRSHKDSLFKSQKILKIVDVFELQASLFMYDFQHDLLPKSFISFVIKKNVGTSMVIYAFLHNYTPSLTKSGSNFSDCCQISPATVTNYLLYIFMFSSTYRLGDV